MDDARLYMDSRAKLPIIIKVGDDFLKSPTEPVPFHALIFFTSEKTLLGKLKAEFFDLHTNSSR